MTIRAPRPPRSSSRAAQMSASRDVISGVPAEISTSYVERQNLSVRMSNRRFARLTTAFSKKLENHAAAVSLYVSHYNLCRVHESLNAKRSPSNPRQQWLLGSPIGLGRLVICWTLL
jgi:hypothetical protein